jgi:DNA topoisomerase III
MSDCADSIGMKDLFIAEKPSVAAEFARVLGVGGSRRNGYIEDDKYIVTWCVGHLVTMSYPDKYDEKLKRWSTATLPFIPKEFKYEVIENVKPQFETVKQLLNRSDVGCIYICTDSGREGEYIYRLTDRMAQVPAEKKRRRVWIDSQTEEEIRKGIREAKDWSEYDNLSASAYLRAKEDYLMGINFSRILTLKYGDTVSAVMKKERVVISVGRVMTCVLGMTVRREREIRNFTKTPFYRILVELGDETQGMITCEWRAAEGSEYSGSPKLYKENGFKKREDAELLKAKIEAADHAVLLKKEKKKETKNPPLLYNLAEIQNDCSRRFKISPDETLKIIQELYEKKLVTYPRTDARVLSSAVAKEIDKNLRGLAGLSADIFKLPEPVSKLAAEVLAGDAYRKIGKSRYTNDSAITDHYAIIPTGQGFSALRSLGGLQMSVYELICRRFLSIFFPPAVYEKIALEWDAEGEHLFHSARLLKDPGYMRVVGIGGKDAGTDRTGGERGSADTGSAGSDGAGRGSEDDQSESADAQAWIAGLKKNSKACIYQISIKESETTPPKRYTTGSMILAMENAGQLIEDEDLRAMIKGSGIGTSATRAEILKKLENIKYLAVNKKTQVITPTLMGEMVYEVVYASIRALLNPDLTASWEKGLSYVAQGTITEDEYMQKLDAFVSGKVNGVKNVSNKFIIPQAYKVIAGYYGTRAKRSEAAIQTG